MIAALAIAFTMVASPARADYPVVLVHGFCSDASTWDTLWNQLPRRRFGEELVRYYQAADGSVQTRTSLRSNDRRTFAIDFYDRSNRSFDARRVADVAITDKVGELKAVIDRIKADTNAAKVIVIGHSMGGLVARSYVQGWGLNFAGRAVTYGDDVAALITIDTPHAGSTLANLPVDFTGFSTCTSDATLNKAELTPGSGFLTTINSRAWPENTSLDALVSYYTSGAFVDSDVAVSRSSQDPRNVSSYWANHPTLNVHLQSFLTPYSLGGPLLHNDILRTYAPATASRIQTIIDRLDRSAIGEPQTSSLTGTWSGRWSSTDGEGDIALRLMQSGSTVTGWMDLFGGSTAIPGTFRGTITQTGGTTAMSWSISYRSPGTTCDGSFGGDASATATTLRATYTGADCSHRFSNGALTLTFAPPPAASLAASRRFVASESSLYLSDFTSSGTDAYVGRFRLSDGTPVSVTDIAIAPGGAAYALAFSTIFALDTATAWVAPLGGTALRNLNALTTDSRGQLWAASTDGSVYTINAGDGIATLMRQFGSGWRSSGDLAFDATGLLWATVTKDGEATDTLVTIDPATGATSIKATSLPAGLFGTAFVNGALFAVSSSTNGLYRIDGTNGAAAFVRRLAYKPVGATRAPR